MGLETGEWRRCRLLSSTPPASLRSHGSRPRPTRHTHHFTISMGLIFSPDILIHYDQCITYYCKTGKTLMLLDLNL